MQQQAADGAEVAAAVEAGLDKFSSPQPPARRRLPDGVGVYLGPSLAQRSPFAVEAGSAPEGPVGEAAGEAAAGAEPQPTPAVQTMQQVGGPAGLPVH